MRKRRCKYKCSRNKNQIDHIKLEFTGTAESIPKSVENEWIGI